MVVSVKFVSSSANESLCGDKPYNRPVSDFHTEDTCETAYSGISTTARIKWLPDQRKPPSRGRLLLNAYFPELTTELAGTQHADFPHYAFLHTSSQGL